MSRMRRSFVFVAIFASTGYAQVPTPPSIELPPQSVSLVSLSGFRPTSANWKIAGGAMADRNRPLVLVEQSGTGVLVNTPAAGALGHLFTQWEHGDLDASFDVMMPKGSNSGVYLMGRYEVQLFDSWGERAPTFADLGAIYQRWDTTRGVGREGYGGSPPRQNASRAPGLWQHVEISFRAPKFAGTRKVANARFAKVTVNGVVVQEHVEVTGPTRAAAFEDERPSGPLMIQGDHGPVAVRNIQYKSYSGAVTLAALRYRTFEGESMDSSYAATHPPVREGIATAIGADPAGAPDKFAVLYDGTMSVPTTGRYRFQLNLGWIGTDSETTGASVGGGKLTIDGRTVVLHSGAERRAYADAELTAGQHAFALSFYKNRPSFNRREVALWVEGPGVLRQALHDEGGSNAAATPANPIIVEPQLEPVVLRSFVRHNNTKRVIAVSVADPLGVHFSYDLAQGALLYVWRGPFLETTQMWHERGEDQTAQPLGSAITLPGTPALAVLPDANAAWPDTIVDTMQFRREGYQLDKAGRPTFLYQVGGVAVADNMRPAADGLSLRRELRLRVPATAGTSDGLYFQIARDLRVVRQSDGSYLVGDGTYLVVLPGSSAQPVVRRQNGRDELLLPVRFDRGEAVIAYTIVW